MLRFAKALLCSALALAAAGSGSAAARPALRSGSPGPGAVWDLGRDLTANAKGAHANPFPDSFGAAGVWHLMGSASTAHTPSTYVDFTTFVPAPVCGVPGLVAWNNGGEPVALVKVSAGTVKGNSCAPYQLLEPFVALVHPSSVPSDAVVAWKSPVAGTVSIAGGVTDADCGAGNGIGWSVDRGSTSIAKGVIPNCGKQRFPAGLTADVTPGQLLYVLIDPGGDYSYDLTRVDLTITLTKAGSAGADAATTTAGTSRVDTAKVLAQPPPPTARPASPGHLELTGLAEVGRPLGVFITSQWEPQNRLAVAYRWQRCTPACIDIAGATGSIYYLTAADVGARLRAQEIASNSVGSNTLSTVLSAVVKAPQVEPRYRKLPSIAGDATVGTLLDGDPGQWEGTLPIGYTYQWQRCTVEGLCSAIAGATRFSYRVTAADEGTTLRLRVVADNDVKAVYALSAPTEEVVPDQDAVIRQAFQIALGRPPGADETASWKQQGRLTVKRLVPRILALVGQNAALAGDVVDTAYLYVYGHVHNSLQAGQFSRDTAAERRSPKTYDDLVGLYAGELASQAYSQIFFWDPTLRRHTVAAWVTLVREGFFDGKGMSKGEQLWTAIALSNDPIHGAARTSYATGAAGSANREGCFGGIGPGCSGAIDPPEVVGDDGSDFAPFVTRDGRLMKYIRLKTAVGSIVHDSTCRVNVGGAWCKLDAGNFAQSETPIVKYFKEATEEWNKAVADTLEGRKWDEYFGPYPDRDITPLLAGKHAGDITYSDDLRPVASQTRYTEVRKGGLVFGLLDFTSPHQWGGRELRAETRLEAPPGTTLDGSDRDYCASGRFARKGSDYGICK